MQQAVAPQSPASVLPPARRGPHARPPSRVFGLAGNHHFERRDGVLSRFARREAKPPNRLAHDMTTTLIEWVRGDDGIPGESWNPIRARNRETGKHGSYCGDAMTERVHCYAKIFNHWVGTQIDLRPQNRDRVEVYLDVKRVDVPRHAQRSPFGV